MAKEFFKSYLACKKLLAERDTEDTLNMKCLNVFEKYLFLYKWCRNDTERQIFENILGGTAPNRMIIRVERNGTVETLKPDSIRSASSRLNKRFYGYFGSDFGDVLLSNPSVPENRKKLNILMAKCISVNDDFIFQNHYSGVLQNMIESVCRQNEKTDVPDELIFSKDMLDVLTFFKLYDNGYILSRLKKLDGKSISLIYRILTTPEYFLQRAEVPEYFVKQSSDGVQTQAYEKRIEDLTLELQKKKDEAESLKRVRYAQENKQSVINALEESNRKLSEDNDKLSAQIADLKADLKKKSYDYDVLDDKHEKLYEKATEVINEQRKRIEYLTQETEERKAEIDDLKRQNEELLKL